MVLRIPLQVCPTRSEVHEVWVIGGIANERSRKDASTYRVLVDDDTNAPTLLHDDEASLLSYSSSYILNPIALAQDPTTHNYEEHATPNVLSINNPILKSEVDEDDALKAPYPLPQVALLPLKTFNHHLSSRVRCDSCEALLSLCGWEIESMFFKLKKSAGSLKSKCG